MLLFILGSELHLRGIPQAFGEHLLILRQLLLLLEQHLLHLVSRIAAPVLIRFGHSREFGDVLGFGGVAHDDAPVRHALVDEQLGIGWLHRVFLVAVDLGLLLLARRLTRIGLLSRRLLLRRVAAQVLFVGRAGHGVVVLLVPSGREKRAVRPAHFRGKSGCVRAI